MGPTSDSGNILNAGNIFNVNFSIFYIFVFQWNSLTFIVDPQFRKLQDWYFYELFLLCYS